MNIVLPKADYSKKEIIWEALLGDGQYRPDPITLIEMRKKIDLEHFQIEVFSSSIFICIVSQFLHVLI